MSQRRVCIMAVALLCGGALLVASAVADSPPNAAIQAKEPSSPNTPAISTSETKLNATEGASGVKMIPTNQGKLVPWVAPAPPSGQAAPRGVGFDGSPGTDAPPATLGGFPMTPFPDNPAALGTVVTTAAAPNPPCEGDITFDPAMQLQAIGTGWNTWSHDYAGQVYIPEAYAEITTLLITMPANTCAFYLYVEPNNYEAHEITCIANEGLADEVSSGPVAVTGSAGATYFGFFSDATSHIETVRVNAVVGAQGFAVGEFGISCGETCVVAPVACCFDETSTCTDSYSIVDCINEGGRFELGIEYCADLTPLCGAALGACCCGPNGESGVCEAYECIGDMTGPECLALGEETTWHPTESCLAIPPFDCNEPTYCDVAYSDCSDTERTECTSGAAPDDWITNVTFSDINNDTFNEMCPDSYGDYTSLVAYVTPTQTYPLSVTFCSENAYTEYVSAWIDWNQDKTFDATERYDLGSGIDATLVMDILVPADAEAGATRMRVIEEYNAYPADACSGATYGETEDYTVFVGDPPEYGACCVAEVCYFDDDPPMNQEACDLLGGFYHGDGSDCDPNPCVGACCDTLTGTCTVVTEAACTGVYQGDGTDCDPNPCVGACCDPVTGDCALTTEGFCSGVYQGDGTECDPNPCPQPAPECPIDSLVAQRPHLPDEAWMLGVSNVGFPYIRYENFTDCNGTVTEITWWGGELTASFANCDRSPNDFQIYFYSDDGTGLHPQTGFGSLCSYTLSEGMYTRTLAGYQYHETYQVELYEYHAVLATPCVVPPTGWFSLQGINDEASDCRFWWVSSPDGDLYHCGGPSAPDVCGGDNNFDFAFCFTGEYVPRFGACCDPSDGSCTDNVEIINCVPPLQFTDGVDNCATLDPPCGNPGACCDDLTGLCTETLQLNCTGRFAAGETCASVTFDPPCGELPQCKLLYAPTEADNPTFRAEVSALTLSDCDYFDARAGTPTLAQMQQYNAVFTWVNYGYSDMILMGDNLADYLESGGKVILGQWTFDNGQTNHLEGRIMTEYAIITSSGVGAGSYALDGTMCMHLGVGVYSSDYWDTIVSAVAPNMLDGTRDDGAPAVAFSPSQKLYYSGGNTGGTYGTGDWAKLVANMVCMCTGEPMFGSCCDPVSGICADGVEVGCCPTGHQWSPDACADRVPPCGNAGACCDPFTGDCEDAVFEANCPAGNRFVPGEECAELNPECGTPGCCCDNEDGVTPMDPFESLEANCGGRFLPGVTGGACVGTAFEPECGLFQCNGMLYAPTNADNVAFRDAVAAYTGQPCDYWDPRAGAQETPTLADLEGYCCVFTWGNYAYADPIGMGDVLADFVDAGGKVILGQWTVHTTQTNWLEGRIMTPAYIPITATSYSTTTAQAYADDGVDCVHILGGVSTYDTNYRDQITPIVGALSDGTFLEDGLASVAWRADRAVYYSAGNTGSDFSSGLADWALLTANMCFCDDGPLVGACCDEAAQSCTENVNAADCTMPGARFLLGGACCDFEPACGFIVGACCDGTTCTEERPSECTGDYKGDGVPCTPNPCLEFLMDDTPVTTCEGTFLDSGGATGPYDIYEEYTKTFTPDTAGQVLQFEFTFWDVEGCCDHLTIYDGGDTSAPEIGVFDYDSPGTIIANNATGQLTFWWSSDLSVTPEGWEATISCIDPPVGACCVGPACTMETFIDCEALTGTWYAAEDCATFECPVGGCEHSVTLWDDYGDGWNGNTLDVLVNGVIVLEDIGLASGSGPETWTFTADTGDAITTVFEGTSWPYENEYCIYDGEGTELGCDGQGGVDPVGIAVTGFCPTCDHTVTLWDDYGDGWNGNTLDVLVNGVLVLEDLTIASGYGPESHTFTVMTGDTITTVFEGTSWPYENEYCIYDFLGAELGCDGQGGVDPVGISVTANCEGIAPPGACCQSDGSCTDEADEAACDAAGGTFQGSGTECSTAICGGACCDPADGTCTDVASEADCAGVFQGIGTECTTTACPAPGDSCDNTYQVTLGTADLPYVDVNTNCGRGDNYDDSASTGCLYYYDSGEDMIYELEVTEAMDVTITLDPGATTYPGIAFGSTCAPMYALDCVAAYSSAAEPLVIGASPDCLHLEPGTYFIQVDTWSSPDCIPDFTLTIDACTSGGFRKAPAKTFGGVGFDHGQTATLPGG